MNTKFFPELARRLRQEGVATGPAEKGRLPVLLDGQEVMWVEPEGYIVLVAGMQDSLEATQIYCTVRDNTFLVNEYTRAMASAPVLKAVGLHEEYRLLAEYDGVVLAGQELDRGLIISTPPTICWRASPSPDGGVIEQDEVEQR